MTQLEILADPTLSKETPGNLLVLQADLVPGATLHSEPQVAILLTVNDGEAATDELEELPATELYFRMPLDQALELSDGIVSLVKQSENERIAVLTQALEFKSAQLSCAKGIVGALEVVKVADSDRGDVVGFGFYDLIYTDDSGDEQVIHEVKNVECYVPFIEEEQYEWLRTLVGGNHQFTSTIKIKLTGLNLEDVRNEFLAKFGQHIESHHDHA